MSAPRVHHSAVCVQDVDVSLAFYREGVGLTVLMDHAFDGPWDELFGAATRSLRSVFLGDPELTDSGIVELVSFEGGTGGGPAPAPPANGFFLLSFFVDVAATIERLRALGFGEDARRVEVPGPAGPVAMATLRDPDGVLVELVDAAGT